METNQKSVARIVTRNGRVIGAHFPGRFSIRIARVPYYDTDRDGMRNGYTHALQVDPDCKEFDRIRRSVGSPLNGRAGSPQYLGTLIKQIVSVWNSGKDS